MHACFRRVEGTSLNLVLEIHQTLQYLAYDIYEMAHSNGCAQMHIHAAALDAKVAAALASANAQHAIPQDTFVQLPGQFAGVGSVWVAWRAGDATSATPFAGRLVTQDQA